MATTKTTYRVQGLPSDASSADAKAIISRALGEDNIRQGPTIHSLASDPYKPPNASMKVATVTFEHAPESLKNCNELTVDVYWFGTTYHISVDSLFMGFTPLNDTEGECGDAIDIIAVSGLSSHPFGSWKARGGTFMWLRDEVAKTAERARVLLYGYDTSLVDNDSFQDIGDIATRLSSDINAIRDGRFAIYKMSKQHPDDFLSIYGLLLFGVPNNGIKTEYWMPIVDTKPNKGLITSLEPNSPYLRDLQENFNRVFRFPDARVTSVYETKKSPTIKEESTGKWKLNGPLDILVTRESAQGRYSHQVQHSDISFNQNHADLPKFINKYDENYRAIKPFLTKCYNEALEVIRKRFVEEAILPKYKVDSADRSRLTCPCCQEIYHSRLKFLRHLKGRGTDVCYMRVLRNAIKDGQLSTASVLLVEDDRVHELFTERTGTALLHDAAKDGQLDAVRLLLERGGEIEMRSSDASTPLMYAASNGKVDVVEFLLGKGARINASDCHRCTSLAYATWNGEADVVRLLLHQGADLEKIDGSGNTPLIHAVWEGKTDVVKLLLNQGANVHARRCDGRSAFDIANQYREHVIYGLLLENEAR